MYVYAQNLNHSHMNIHVSTIQKDTTHTQLYSAHNTICNSHHTHSSGMMNYSAGLNLILRMQLGQVWLVCKHLSQLAMQLKDLFTQVCGILCRALRQHNSTISVFSKCGYHFSTNTNVFTVQFTIQTYIHTSCVQHINVCGHAQIIALKWVA